MVDRQPTLFNVHGPRVDQPLRRSLQPHLHLRTLTLGAGVPCRFSQLSEEPLSRWVQPRRPRLHNVPCSNLVLSPRGNITGQDRKEHDQALAGTRPKPPTPRDSLLPRNLAAGAEMKAETHKVARLHAILWGIFSLGGMIAAFLLPVLIYMTAIAYPFGIWPFGSPSGCLSCPTRDPSFLVIGHLLGALFVFVTIAGSLYHGIFRFQSALTEVGLLRLKRGLEAVGYSIIFAGIILLAYYLLVLNPSLPAL